jgi:hypothetical protein
LLREQRLADNRNIGQQRNANRFDGGQNFGFVGLADERRQADAENRQRQPGGDLVAHQGQHHDGKQVRHQRARGHAGQHPQPDVAGFETYREAGDRAHRHHAFRAEVQHTRFLGDQLAQRNNDQRCTGDDGGEQDRAQNIHQATASFQRKR